MLLLCSEATLGVDLYMYEVKLVRGHLRRDLSGQWSMLVQLATVNYQLFIASKCNSLDDGHCGPTCNAWQSHATAWHSFIQGQHLHITTLMLGDLHSILCYCVGISDAWYHYSRTCSLPSIGELLTIGLSELCVICMDNTLMRFPKAKWASPLPVTLYKLTTVIIYDNQLAVTGGVCLSTLVTHVRFIAKI